MTDGNCQAIQTFASGYGAPTVRIYTPVKVERNRLNLDGVDQYDQHFL
jgi:hypothetical protein